MPSDSEPSITTCIGLLQKRGDDHAAEVLYKRYVGRLLALAREELKNWRVTKRHVDADDIVQLVLDTFFRHAKDGGFPRLKDRDNLWPLLLSITEHKAMNAVRDLLREKRGAGKVLGEQDVVGPDGQKRNLADLKAAPEPTPDLAIQFLEQVDQLFGKLDDERQRTVARLKMEGYTNKEIATALGCAERTVKSILAKIRSIWVAAAP